MRMRKKKHLDERMNECRDICFEINCDDRNFNTAIEEKEYLDTQKIFGRIAPLKLEIGCGKGQFVCEAAMREPETDFIAVEKNRNVIVAACEKAKELGLKNVYFIMGSAEYLPKFLKDNSISEIYLNFSCPFPKAKYASHRLTAEGFLKIYDRLMTNGAKICQKTDNMQLFEFSLEQLSTYGFALKNVSLDLHNSSFEGNIITEYEKRFSEQGFPIYRLEAYKKER